MTALTTDDATHHSTQEPTAAAEVMSGATLRALASEFALDGTVARIEPLGRGLINETFSVDTGARRYVMQRVNSLVFPRPEQIMSNLRVLDAHLKQLGDGCVRLPALIPTRSGACWERDAGGGYWRMMEFIPDTLNLERIERLEQAREVGAILGRFHRSAAGLPTDQMGVSLPGFHDTPRYLSTLQGLLPEGDEDNAFEACRAFVTARADRADVLHAACEKGRIVRRITHGDPKLDNILFSADGERALALIDLDTVQPGLVHHDLGDCLRSCCNRTGEGAGTETDVRFDLSVCEGILSGYAAETSGMLSAAEIELIFEGIRLLPFELGLRFLTDHLEGDRYFRVATHGDNLRKARIQFALVESIEAQETEIKEMISGAFRA